MPINLSSLTAPATRTHFYSSLLFSMDGNAIQHNEQRLLCVTAEVCATCNVCGDYTNWRSFILNGDGDGLIDTHQYVRTSRGTHTNTWINNSIVGKMEESFWISFWPKNEFTSKWVEFIHLQRRVASESTRFGLRWSFHLILERKKHKLIMIKLHIRNQDFSCEKETHRASVYHHENVSHFFEKLIIHHSCIIPSLSWTWTKLIFP